MPATLRHLTRALSLGIAVALALSLSATASAEGSITSPSLSTPDAEPYVGGPKGELFIPEVDNDTVAVMDTETNTITKRIPLSVPVGPSHPAVLAKTPAGSMVCTDNFGLLSPSISIIDRVNGTTRTIPVESVPLGIFTSGDGKEIYIPEMGLVVEVLDVATDTIVPRLRFNDIPAGAMAGPDGLMYVGFASGLIGAYDPVTGATVKPPIWSGGLATFWYSFTQDGKKLYTDTVNSIDVEKWELTKTVATEETVSVV